MRWKWINSLQFLSRFFYLENRARGSSLYVPLRERWPNTWWILYYTLLFIFTLLQHDKDQKNEQAIFRSISWIHQTQRRHRSATSPSVTTYASRQSGSRDWFVLCQWRDRRAGVDAHTPRAVTAAHAAPELPGAVHGALARLAPCPRRNPRRAGVLEVVWPSPGHRAICNESAWLV
jgi:hypothetical protein